MIKITKKKLKKKEEEKKKYSEKFRGLSLKSVDSKDLSAEDRNTRKLEKELSITKESWKFLSKDKERVNTNQILVFLCSILGLYDGEKPQNESSNTQ